MPRTFTTHFHNLGAQVPNEKLIDYALQVKADAILISQVVTAEELLQRG